MSSSLLSTKLHVPQVRLERVLRLRLVTRLQQGLAKKLTLISAPAGYGKTTLVSEWLASCDRPSAWVSLDNGDNEPPRFWVYVLAAVQNVLSSTGKTLPEQLLQQDPQGGDLVITDLINELDKLQQSLILVLDDYHLIENQSIHDGLTFLLDHAPSHFHLVIATRADPPLPLARLRARSELLELRQADLCFTVSETADFLNHTMGLQISSEDVDRITARTEGWIAGLQMAALSMQNTENISGFITTLTGSHHYIFDYLLEEVLEQQSPEIRRFLLHTSILDQLTAPLCDALIGEEVDSSDTHSSEDILEQLEHTNLFIIALDHERRWYRYHTLFAELLRTYLGQKCPERISALHTRASIWFEGQGLIADAIRHAILSGNWERVVALISVNIFALLEQNELNTVSKQLDRIAIEKSLARPWLWIGRAWLAAYTGQLGDVDSILFAAEAEMSQTMDGQGQQSLRGHCAAIRAFAAWSEGRRDVAMQAAQEALDSLPENDLTLRCQSATVLGLSMADLDARNKMFEKALVYARGCSTSHVVLFTHGCQAYTLFLQGRLREAHAACQEAIQLVGSGGTTHQPLPTLSHVYSALSGILWEWNDLEASLHYAREAVALAHCWEQADALHFAYTNLSNALLAAGNAEEAFNVLQQAWEVAHRTSPWFEEITITQEVEWYLARGDLEAALQCLHFLHIDIDTDPGPSLSLVMPYNLAYILFAQKQYAKALARLETNLDELKKKKVVYFQVRALNLQAIIYHLLGEESQALTSLREALRLAAPQGYMRSFLTTGKVLIPLLQRVRAEGVATDYVGKLLAFLEGGEKALFDGAGVRSGLIEPLSRREIDVLKLLSQGYADKQIAETLIIARETVHKHLKNIYGKLGVHNRTEAVVRARESNLL